VSEYPLQGLGSLEKLMQALPGAKIGAPDGMDFEEFSETLPSMIEEQYVGVKKNRRARAFDTFMKHNKVLDNNKKKTVHDFTAVVDGLPQWVREIMHGMPEDEFNGRMRDWPRPWDGTSSDLLTAVRKD
jgi:hypothetical protein